MAKKKIKVISVELRDGLILLKIINFDKYIGSLLNKIAKCSQIETNKRDRSRVTTKRVTYN